MLNPLIEAVSIYTGRKSLIHVAEFMAKTLGTEYAFVTDAMNSPATKFRTAVYWANQKIEENFEYELEGTPCELIVKDKEPKYYPDKLYITFPKEKEYGYVSYHAVPLMSPEGNVIGHLGVADSKSMDREKRAHHESILSILALKVEAELMRLRNDEERDKYLNKIEIQKEQLERNFQELQKLNNQKNYFIRALSHDIRAPFAQIKGFLNVVEMDGPKLTERQREAIDHINSISDRSIEMIKKMLDIDSLKPEEIQVKIEPLDAVKIVREAITRYQILADDKGIKLELALCHDNNETIALDENYFLSILENLLSNAIKYSPNNSQVSVCVNNTKDHLKIEVVDQGPGISEEDCKKLFKEYSRVGSNNNENSTGLGLYIVKNFTEAMSGSICCESELGKGARFVVEFPKG